MQHSQHHQHDELAASVLVADGGLVLVRDELRAPGTFVVQQLLRAALQDGKARARDGSGHVSCGHRAGGRGRALRMLG